MNFTSSRRRGPLTALSLETGSDDGHFTDLTLVNFGVITNTSGDGLLFTAVTHRYYL